MSIKDETNRRRNWKGWELFHILGENSRKWGIPQRRYSRKQDTSSQFKGMSPEGNWREYKGWGNSTQRGGSRKRRWCGNPMDHKMGACAQHWTQPSNVLQNILYAALNAAILESLYIIIIDVFVFSTTFLKFLWILKALFLLDYFNYLMMN